MEMLTVNVFRIHEKVKLGAHRTFMIFKYEIKAPHSASGIQIRLGPEIS